MTREPIEVTRQDRIYCLKVSSDYHSEVCEECKFYPNCDHMTQDDLTELTIRDLEALEQQPCEDAISRKEALEALEQEEPLVWCDGADEIAAHNQWSSDVDTIKNMPSVQPKPKTGQWVLLDECSNSGYYCSECHKKLVKEGWSGTVKKIKFCPNCGAKLESEKT